MVDINEIKAGRISLTEQVFHTVLNSDKIMYVKGRKFKRLKYLIVESDTIIMEIYQDSISIDYICAVSLIGFHELKDFEPFRYGNLTVDIKVLTVDYGDDVRVKVPDKFDTFVEFIENIGNLQFWND